VFYFIGVLVVMMFKESECLGTKSIRIDILQIINANKIIITPMRINIIRDMTRSLQKKLKSYLIRFSKFFFSISF